MSASNQPHRHLPGGHSSRQVFYFYHLTFRLKSLRVLSSSHSRGRGFDSHPLHVAELLKEVEGETRGLWERSGLTCMWQSAPGLSLLYTDSGKLKVVIKRLVGNSIKFTAQGSVTVEARGREGGIEISVTDTGVGIPAEAFGVIFEPFRQLDSSNIRRHLGTGLGLHIVKRLLTLLGGTITVESEVGRGSTFCIWLPPRPPFLSE